ncbi:MAG: ATP-binding cassette domain-containing protein [Enterocloster sp.]|uniref:ATP-binding cassette domain-containing protein n=1 Tax=Enterocloster sp. TaxID=2719315 RepID=UPI00399B9F05
MKKVEEILDPPITFPAARPFRRHCGITSGSCLLFLRWKDRCAQGLLLTVAPGEKVALVGVSGAGKSTVIQLMARSYDVAQGTVRIGGRDVRELDYEDLLDHLSPGVPEDLSDPGKRAGKHSHELGSNTGAGARGCQAGANR